MMLKEFIDHTGFEPTTKDGTHMFTEEGRVTNLYNYLKQSKHSDIRIRTSLVHGGWHDNEASARAAGFSIKRYIDKEYEAKHEFAECYRLIRNT